MKQLLALAVLVLVFGVGGLVYRNALEQPLANTNRDALACAPDTFLCPDGTAVGRTGTSCAFAACPYPNVEIRRAEVAFAVPPGFVRAADAPADAAVVAAFARTGFAGEGDARIEVRRYAVSTTTSANQVALATARTAAGTRPGSMQNFSPVIVNGIAFETIGLGIGDEARTAYYLLRERDVLRFDAIDAAPRALETATTSTELPSAVPVRPAHNALLRLLETLRQDG